jgi:hypothetical protein
LHRLAVCAAEIERRKGDGYTAHVATFHAEARTIREQLGDGQDVPRRPSARA